MQGFMRQSELSLIGIELVDVLVVVEKSLSVNESGFTQGTTRGHHR